jgi:adenylate cyclase
MKQRLLTALKNALWDWRGVWIAAPIATGLVIATRQVGLLQYWEWAAFDLYMRLRPAEQRDQRIGIVGINESDVQSLSQAILPDRVYAKLINKLKQMHPVGIGLDVYRDVPIEPGHQELEQVFRSTNNLVGIEKVIGVKKIEYVPGARTLKQKNQIASNDLIHDHDNRVRRALLSLKDLQGKQIFGFGAYLALLYLEQQGITPSLSKDGSTWRLGQRELTPFSASDGGYAQADDGGYQILLNYRGNREHFETVSLSDILENRVSHDWGRHRLILIGYTGFSFQDIVATPFTSNPSERMSGVEVHANVASQIISIALDGRPQLLIWQEVHEKAWIFFWAVLGAFISWSQRNRLLSRRRMILMLVSLVVLVGIGYAMFRKSIWIPVVPPSLAFIGSISLLTGYTARSAVRVRQTFSRYLSTEVVSTLLERNESLKLGGDRRVITILMADLRGFTAFCEKLSPEEVIKVVNCYLSSMTEVISQYKGTIDGFLGDGILVLFGAPIVREDDASRAIACGIAMQESIVQVNNIIQSWGYAELEMGVGINTGEVIVGNIGSEKRMAYSVVGSHVNLASRIESFTVGGQVLISESTLKASNSNVRIKGKNIVHAKGFSEPITIYDVIGIDHHDVSIEKEISDLSALDKHQKLSISLINQKSVSEERFSGELIGFMDKIARITLNSDQIFNHISVPDELKITFLNQEKVSTPEDVYAKIIAVDFRSKVIDVKFTFFPESVRLLIVNLINQKPTK